MSGKYCISRFGGSELGVLKGAMVFLFRLGAAEIIDLTVCPAARAVKMLGGDATRSRQRDEENMDILRTYGT